jgi:IS5 family transposase
MKKAHPVKRTNKIDNADLFTNAATHHYEKHIKTQSKQTLKFIDAKINWSDLLRPIERTLSHHKAGLSSAGRPTHELLVIVKCFLLQTIYNLSDPRLEEEIADRRSFQLFLGLNSGDAIPDETTICRYRELFSRLGLDRKLFSAFTRQLEKHGLIIGKGTIVDATLKEAQANKYSERDGDARGTSRKGKAIYGYKGHVGVDADTNVIHSLEFTPANVHDTEKFDDLLLGSEKRVYADKGYAQRQRRMLLKMNGIRCGILHKAYRNRPLTKKQLEQNKAFAKIRSAVERPFSYMTTVLDYTRCRYYDIRRNTFQFIFAAMVYNMRRLITLTHRL